MDDWESGNDYTTGQVRVAWAAQHMGITFEQLVEAARTRGVSVWGGIAWDDLIPITREELVREGDPVRRAQLGLALKTFILTRKRERAA